MKEIFFIVGLLFPILLFGVNLDHKISATTNFLIFNQQKELAAYREQFDLLKMAYVNKLNLIRGENLKYPQIKQNELFSDWQIAIDFFIQNKFKESLDQIHNILKVDPDQFKNVCQLKIINSMYLNELDKIEDELYKCKVLTENLNSNNFIFLESILETKFGKYLSQTDRYFYEYGQDFSTIDEIRRYLKLALVLDDHQKIINLIPNLPPMAYENAEIRELLSFVFFRMKEFDKSKKFLKKTDSINSNNLLGSLLVQDNKIDLAFARYLVSYKISNFTPSTLNRLIPLSIQLKNFSKGLEFISKKKFFKKNIANEISSQELEDLSLYFNIKNKKYNAAIKQMVTLETINVLPVIEELSTITKIKIPHEENAINNSFIKSCKKKNLLSCYFLSVLYYFPGLEYYLKEFNANKTNTNETFRDLYHKINFRPIKENALINQKYIEELDSL